jgi:exodeoxyribonuclease VII large subunit
MTDQSPDRQILSITQLNRRARQLLETQLPLLWVRGEISNFSRPGSGHWYLTLKDSDAQIRCAMFRNRNQTVRIQPQNGDQVLVRGRVSLYEARGDYQFIIEHMEADGAGLLQQRFNALKDKLQNEGLFDPDHKRPLPCYPRTIGVITSPTGAAIRDILHISARRYPWININVYPSPVQGDGAAPNLVSALRLANEHGEADVLILARGGGSLEDLWAFNEEMVARAIYDSGIPVISAVGHETDFTIADFVADYRAPTPSGAAEIAGPDKVSLSNQLARTSLQLQSRLQQTLNHQRQTLLNVRKRLRDPRDRLQQQSQHLDHLRVRLHRAWQQDAGLLRTQLNSWQQRLAAVHPSTQLSRYRELNERLGQRLGSAFEGVVRQRRHQLAMLAGTLDAVSPLNTLDRGYAIVRNNRGHAVTSVARVTAGDKVSVTLRDGDLEAVTTAVTSSTESE